LSHLLSEPGSKLGLTVLPGLLALADELIE
jgi:hypothetical protein